MRKPIWSVFLAFIMLTVLLSGCATISTPILTFVPSTFTPSSVPSLLTPTVSLTPTETSTPQGTIVFAYSNGQTYLIMKMNSDGSDKAYLTRDRHWDQDPAWTMDGKYIFFTRDGDIFRMDADGSNVRQITKEAANERDPAPSPDGQRVAYVVKELGIYHICVINVDGSGPKCLADGTDPAWSPDGRLIAYSVDGSIFVIEPDGEEPKKLISLKDKSLRDPAWSPDGKRIAYTTSYRGPIEDTANLHLDILSWITITDADGTNVFEIDDLSYSIVEDPSWSPDGMWLSVMSQRGDGSGIFISIIKTDGSGDVKNLTEEFSDSESASWGP